MSNHAKSSEDIRREIEHTRNELGNTVDAIQDRLQPDNLRAQAQEVIQSTLTDTADSIVEYVNVHRSELQSSLMDTIKRNPLPSLLIGAGVGWLLVDMLSSSGDDVGHSSQRYDGDRLRMVQRPRDYYRYEQSGAGYSGARYANANADRYDNDYQGDDDNWVQSALHTAQDKVGDVAGVVHDVAAQAGGAIQGAAANVGDALQGAAAKAGDAVQETTGAIGDKVQRSAGQIGRQASLRTGAMGNQAQFYARRAQHTTQRTVSDNPLLFSAMAMGAGVAIALLLPHTRQEDELMGELRDQVTENATAAAADVAERARTVVEEVAPEVKQAAQRVAEAVKQTGQESLEQVKKSTAEAVDKVQNKTESTVKSEAEKAMQDVQRHAPKGKEAVSNSMNL